MSDLMTIIAALEWIALGFLYLHGLRKWNKKFSDLYDELKKEIFE